MIQFIYVLIADTKFKLNYLEENYHHEWATDMKALLKKAITLKTKMTPEQYTESLEERTAI